MSSNFQCWESKRLLGRWTPVLGVVLAISEVFCIGGIFFGFSSALRVLLQAEGFFAAGCNATVAELASGNASCDSQNEGFSRVNAVGTGMQLLCSLPMGLLLDRVGFRACKCLCACVGFITCLCLGLATPSTAWLLYIAAVSWSIASSVSIVSSLGVTELFPAYREILICLVSGTFDSSAVLFTLIQTIAYGSGSDSLDLMYRRRLTCFICLAVLAAVVCLVNGLVILPPRHIRHTDQFRGLCNPFSFCCGDDQNKRPKQAIFELKEPLEHDPTAGGGAVAKRNDPDDSSAAADDDDAATASAATAAAAESEVTPLDKSAEPMDFDVEVRNSDISALAAESELPPLQSVLLTRMFACHVAWAGFSILRFFIFLNSVALYVKFAVDGSEPELAIRNSFIMRYLSMLGLFLSLGLCFAFFTAGVVRISGRLFNARSTATSDVWQRCRFLAPPFVLQCSLGLLLSCLSFVAQHRLIPLQYTLLALYRSMLFSLASCLLFSAFPAAHFGTLYGVMCLACGLVSFSQIPLRRLAELSGLNSANFIALALSAAAFVHPVQILLAERIPCGLAVPDVKRRSGPTSENLLT